MTRGGGGAPHFPDMFPRPRHSKTMFIPANTRERRTALSLNGTLVNRRPRIECIKKELSPEDKRFAILHSKRESITTTVYALRGESNCKIASR